MSTNLNAPDDDDIKFKRTLYEKIKINLTSQFIQNRKLPKSKTNYKWLIQNKNFK